GFEHSEVNRFLGYVYYAQEKYPQAIRAYLAFINEPEADAQKRTDTRYTVAQLMFITEDYRSAAGQLEKWMKEAAVVDRGGKILLARAYYNLGKKNESLKLVEAVMRESEAAGVTPKESYLNFQWVLYYEKERYKDAVGVNRVLLTHYPKVKYWKQLAAMYGALEETQRELLALELTYIQDGLDKEKQFVALAYQYMAFDVPYRAAKVLEKAMAEGKVEKNEKNLEILGSAYQRAQEFKKASPILEQAAKLASDGNAWSRLAGVYLNLNENEKALVAAINALSKGSLKRPDLTWMNRGSAEAALHCYDEAARSFTRASKFERSAKGASNWKRYVQMEGDRRKKLIANGAKLATCKKV
ncbi:MAG: tetratricopeptide repeat protein, partial [Pseudomonadales bacterium]|nr:tetratricopeptide repeat protein [Pseudomonadales bacterium]